ncbi:histidinol-phosphatase [Hypericibacter sp.]|uniref:histidinol-phosphatase n=1 Tax=Hypericibacter sp. TaxID=2705401 RepID=UPI003D6D8B59
MTSAKVPSEFVSFAHELAEASGKVIARYFRQPIDIITKEDLSPVTIADRETESAMRALIKARFPGHGIVGEEHGTEKRDAEFVWVLDPIDGTKSFISGRPLFGTLIALCQNGRPVLGVIDHPAIGERWIGAHGHPTQFQGKPVRVRACPDLSKASLFASSPEMFEPEDQPRYWRLREACKMSVYGSDCYHYGIIASGFGDVAIEANMGIYDYLSTVPVIEGAGGVVTDWQGNPLTMASDDKVLACGDARAHEKVLKLIA